MRHLQRARHVPGPFLIALACLIAPVRIDAHDPGLSALDVLIDDRGISGSLAIAASDVAAMWNGELLRERVDALARDSVRLSLNEQLLPVTVEAVAIDQGTARVQMRFGTKPGSQRSGRLTIASDVPARLLPGHRELIVLRIGDRRVAERLIGAGSGIVTADLEARSGPGAHEAPHFLQLGFHHILEGHDHLLFLLGLLLAAGALRQLVIALSAFTAAHSLSLALVVAGGVNAPPRIVEPLIALSIAWIGVENLVRSRPDTGWKIVFAFGLIHGLGFAGALSELNVATSFPETAVALVSFNAGVEAGQLAVAGAMLPFVWFARSRPAIQAAFAPLCSLMIVAAGVYWLIERLA